MAHKEPTIQLGARIKRSLKNRADAFCIRHPLQPSLAALIEAALTEYLDREEAKLPKQPTAKRG
jgi:hypothetical protein